MMVLFVTFWECEINATHKIRNQCKREQKAGRRTRSRFPEAQESRRYHINRSMELLTNVRKLTVILISVSINRH